MGKAAFISTGGTSTPAWRTLTARTMCPPQGDFALVLVKAARIGSWSGAPVEFGEQFVDAVSLVLKTQPDKIELAERAKAEYEQAQKDKAVVVAIYAEKKRQKLETAAKAQADQEQNEKRKAEEAKAFEEKIAKDKADKGKSE